MPVQERPCQALRIVERGVRDLDGVALTAVADGRHLLDLDLPLFVPGRDQGSGQAGLQLPPHPIEARRVPRVHRHAQRALLRVAHAGAGASQGGEHAGMGGDDHGGDRERAGQLDRVHRPGAAEGEERAPAPVDAALHRDPAQRAQHGRVGDPDDCRERPPPRSCPWPTRAGR